MTGAVEVCGRGILQVAPEPDTESWGARADHPSPESFTLSRDRPGTHPVYYRADHGRLEWSDALVDFLPPSGAVPVPDPGDLLARIHGAVPAPDATVLPGVRRLTTGTMVRVDPTGVTVTRWRPQLPGTRRSLLRVLGDVLAALEGDYVIAYSGGISSAFTAVSSVKAGREPMLLHADLGLEHGVTALPEIHGLTARRVGVDPYGLLDHHPITGGELAPPMPEVEVPARLVAHLRATAGGRPVVSGGLLRALTSVQLPQVGVGRRGWRLLGCEPFHITGTLRDLAEARELIGRQRVFAPGLGGREIPDSRPVGTPPMPRPPGVSPLPGLTAAGEEAVGPSQIAMMALWKDHLDSLGPVHGSVVAELEENGGGGAVLPALDERVLAAVDALGASRLGRIRRGAFENNLPLSRALAADGVVGARREPPRHWLRLMAAGHLFREREKIIAELGRECAFADLGMVEPRRVADALRDGRELAENALPLLRLVWVDRWLRRRT